MTRKGDYHARNTIEQQRAESELGGVGRKWSPFDCRKNSGNNSDLPQSITFGGMTFFSASDRPITTMGNQQVEPLQFGNRDENHKRKKLSFQEDKSNPFRKSTPGIYTGEPFYLRTCKKYPNQPGNLVSVTDRDGHMLKNGKKWEEVAKIDIVKDTKKFINDELFPSAHTVLEKYKTADATIKDYLSGDTSQDSELTKGEIQTQRAVLKYLRGKIKDLLDFTQILLNDHGKTILENAKKFVQCFEAVSTDFHRQIDPNIVSGDQRTSVEENKLYADFKHCWDLFSEGASYQYQSQLMLNIGKELKIEALSDKQGDLDKSAKGMGKKADEVTEALLTEVFKDTYLQEFKVALADDPIDTRNDIAKLLTNGVRSLIQNIESKSDSLGSAQKGQLERARLHAQQLDAAVTNGKKPEEWYVLCRDLKESVKPVSEMARNLGLIENS